MNNVIQALDNLSLTITPNNKTKPAAATNGQDGAAGDSVEQKTETDTTTVTHKIVNLKVELIKYNKKKNNNNSAASDNAGAGGAVNGGGDPAAGGDASSARIESVDTTTV